LQPLGADSLLLELQGGLLELQVSLQQAALPRRALWVQARLVRAAQRLAQVNKILKREKLSAADRATAQAIADDLQDAINTKPPE